MSGMSKDLEFELEDPIYSKQRWETKTHYRFFSVYRDLGPGRTLKQTRQLLVKNNPERTKIPTIRTIAERKVLNRWDDRAAAWDRKQQEESNKELKAKIKKMNEVHFTIADHFLTKAIAKLKQMEKDPQAIEKMSVTELTRLVKVAVDIQRITTGADVYDLNEKLDAIPGMTDDKRKRLEEIFYSKMSSNNFDSN